MYYGNIKFHALEDGPGCRTALFVSGCRNHCKGCFQPQTWNFEYGKPFTEETKQSILDSLNDAHTRGLTILGGEPFEPENQRDVLALIKQVKTQYPEKDIWVYSGFTFEELSDKNSESRCRTEYTDDILKNVDVLVDGKFELKNRNLLLPFRGSSNQRVLSLPESLAENKAVLSKYHNREHEL